MNETIFAAYGSASVEGGVVFVQGSHDDLTLWATRPGAQWPCSVLLRRSKVEVAFGPRGDILDIEQWDADGFAVCVGDDELTSAELSAWASDVLAGCIYKGKVRK